MFVIDIDKLKIRSYKIIKTPLGKLLTALVLFILCTTESTFLRLHLS